MREIKCEVRGENLVIHLPEELDHHSSRNLNRQAEKLLREHRIRRMVFDYSHTDFMDSAGVGAILGQVKRMEPRNGEITAYGVSRRIERLFAMSGIPRFVRICRTAEEAMKPKGEESKA